MFSCGRQGERILDQESFMALFHSHLYKFIDIYNYFEGWGESFRKNAHRERGLLEQKNKLTLGGKGWRSSILSGRGGYKFIDLYILKGGITSSERMLTGLGLAKKN